MNTEKVLDAFDQLDIWPVERSLSAIIAASAQAVGAVKAALPQLARAADGVELKLAAGGRLLYLGAGTSGRLALQDAAELLPTFGFDRALVLMAGGEEAGTTAREDDEDNEEGAWAAIEKAGVTESDIAIGLSASGRTPYTVAGVTEARRRGALTVGIANNPGSALLAAAEVPVLLDTGPQAPAGAAGRPRPAPRGGGGARPASPQAPPRRSLSTHSPPPSWPASAGPMATSWSACDP